MFGTLAPAVSLLPSLCPARVGWWGAGGSTRGCSFKKPAIPHLSGNSVSLGLFERGKGSDFNGKDYSENAREQLENMTRLLQLQAELQGAVEKEDYIHAQQINDDIHDLVSSEIDALVTQLQSAVQVVRKEVDMLSLPNMKYERLQLALQTAIAAQEFAQASLIRDELNLLPPQIKTEKKSLFAELDLEWLQDDLSAGMAKLREREAVENKDAYYRFRNALLRAIQEEDYTSAARLQNTMAIIEHKRERLYMMRQLQLQIAQERILQPNKPKPTPKNKQNKKNAASGGALSSPPSHLSPFPSPASSSPASPSPTMHPHGGAAPPTRGAKAPHATPIGTRGRVPPAAPPRSSPPPPPLDPSVEEGKGEIHMGGRPSQRTIMLHLAARSRRLLASRRSLVATRIVSMGQRPSSSMLDSDFDIWDHF